MRVAAMKARKTAPGESWIVRFPNGQSKRFYEHWKAENARRLLGGRIAHVTDGSGDPGASQG